jgi:AraC-like DNA-binding protein
MSPSCTYALDATWRPILKDLGVSSTQVLRRAGLPDDLLAQPSVRLSTADFYRFWAGIEAEVNDPLFPVLLCHALRSESFSPPLLAALSSPNLHMALQRIARYKRLVAPMRLTVHDEPDRVTLQLAWLDDPMKPPPSLVCTELLFFVFLARMGTRENLCPIGVITQDPPTPASAYESLLGVRVERGTGHQLSFTRADALRPFLTANPGLWAAFEPELRTRLAELDTSVTVGQRVRSVLLEALPGGLVAMDAVASRLAMSRRTLQRHLGTEGTTYLQLLQSTRHALARHYLQNTGLPAAEIAFLLGFEETNSFYRAFRDWTGHTPDQVRQQSRVHGESSHSPH